MGQDIRGSHGEWRVQAKPKEGVCRGVRRYLKIFTKM